MSAHPQYTQVPALGRTDRDRSRCILEECPSVVASRLGPANLDWLFSSNISSAVVAVGGGSLGDSGTHGSVVDEDPSNSNRNRCASLALSGMICVIGVKFDIFAGSLHRLASLYVTGVPGFHHITPRATPTTAVFPKSYVSLGSTVTTCLSWGIDPTAYPPDALLTHPSVEMLLLLKCCRRPSPYPRAIGLSCGSHLRRSVHVSLLDLPRLEVVMCGLKLVSKVRSGCASSLCLV